MIWNPFKRVKLKPVLPTVATTDNPDPVYQAEVERAQLRSLLARTQITMIHETLAARALCHYQGLNSCPD